MKRIRGAHLSAGESSIYYSETALEKEADLLTYASEFTTANNIYYITGDLYALLQRHASADKQELSVFFKGPILY